MGEQALRNAIAEDQGYRAGLQAALREPPRAWTPALKNRWLWGYREGVVDRDDRIHRDGYKQQEMFDGL